MQGRRQVRDALGGLPQPVAQLRASVCLCVQGQVSAASFTPRLYSQSFLTAAESCHLLLVSMFTLSCLLRSLHQPTLGS